MTSTVFSILQNMLLAEWITCRLLPANSDEMLKERRWCWLAASDVLGDCCYLGGNCLSGSSRLCTPYWLRWRHLAL